MFRKLLVLCCIVIALSIGIYFFAVSNSAAPPDEIAQKLHRAITHADRIVVTCQDPTGELPHYVKVIASDDDKKAALSAIPGYTLVKRYPVGSRPGIGFLMMPRWNLDLQGAFPLVARATYDGKDHLVVLELDEQTIVLVKMENALAKVLGISFDEFKLRMRATNRSRLILYSLGLYALFQNSM